MRGAVQQTCHLRLQVCSHEKEQQLMPGADSYPRLEDEEEEVEDVLRGKEVFPRRED